MRCEVVAVGTELLLGQIVDTNSSWMGEHLAAAGIDSHFQVKVGDNLERIVQALRIALSRSEAVIVCGGLGPTQDDITREAIAEVMNVPMERDPEIVERIAAMFRARGREMSPSNERQADVPVGATVIPQTRGTAPGLICPVGHKVVYAVPGVPHEMQDMLERAVIPDLVARSGTVATIVSRVLRTWGLAESTLGEIVGPRLAALDAAGGNPTIAFLASGMEGIKVRVTAKAATHEEAVALLDAEEAELRAILGDIVFGVDDQSMEYAVGTLLGGRRLTLGLAESVTGGLVASRLVNVPGASEWFRGSVVAYSSEVKFDVLDVPEGPVVTEEAAKAMAQGAAKVLGADVGLAVTGVAGPTDQDGMPVGTVFLGVYLDGAAEAVRISLPGDRNRIREFAAISLLDLLRRRLLDRTEGSASELASSPARDFTDG
ncbi:MAG TPA: competence/damage-inducible protein A [Acidimicrobiales bacterium]|nr:competence/damage-inducible protein A [Acidimicrobiales bacterium]